MDSTFFFRSIIFILCSYCINTIPLLSSSKYIIVTEYEENNYCHSITFKNIISKLENKDISNFYIVLKNIDEFDLDFIKKDYNKYNFLLDKEKFNIGDFYIIENKDTMLYKIELNCDERFQPTILDTVIEKLNNYFELLKIKEKIPIFQLPVFPEESLSVLDSLLLFLDKRNVIHEINNKTGDLLFQYEINDSICNHFINRNDENSQYLDIYYKLGYKLKPQNCLYINHKKHFRYASIFDIEFEYVMNDTNVKPKQKFLLSKFYNNNKIESKEIIQYPNTSSYLNFNLSNNTIINVGFINGLEILYLDTNYSLISSKLIDSSYKFANYLSAFGIENGILLYFNNTILSYNFITEKTNKLKLDSMTLNNINPIIPFINNKNLCFFYITKDYKEYGIFDYKKEKIITKINNYFNEELKEIKLFKQENNILYFLVKLEKSRWHIFKLYL